MKRKAKKGATLIDVAAGSMLLAVLLIPSVHLIGESRKSNHRLHRREAMLYQADQVMESTKVALGDPTAFAAALATPVDSSAAVTTSDIPDLHTRVRVAADPTVAPAQLLTIQVDLWQDQDGDAAFDRGEPIETLRTQWAAP